MAQVFSPKEWLCYNLCQISTFIKKEGTIFQKLQNQEYAFLKYFREGSIFMNIKISWGSYKNKYDFAF